MTDITFTHTNITNAQKQDARTVTAGQLISPLGTVLPMTTAVGAIDR